MNAHARQIAPASAAGRAEHVAIEATQDYLETMSLRQPHRPTIASYSLHSSLRGCATELRILQDHFLGVQYQRPRQPPRKFTFDLRFANPRPVRVRNVAWVCLGLAIACCLATAAAFAWAGIAAATFRPHPGFIVGIVGTLATLALLYLFLRRTTESLQFTSVHGNAVLIDLVGGIGAAKAGKHFIVELIRNIAAAKLARSQPPAQFLRDEMREHHRLRELNVIGQEEYEASKARILAAHS